jgi:hypothetical protein
MSLLPIVLISNGMIDVKDTARFAELSGKTQRNTGVCVIPGEQGVVNDVGLGTIHGHERVSVFIRILLTGVQDSVSG